MGSRRACWRVICATGMSQSRSRRSFASTQSGILNVNRWHLLWLTCTKNPWLPSSRCQWCTSGLLRQVKWATYNASHWTNVTEKAKDPGMRWQIPCGISRLSVDPEEATLVPFLKPVGILNARWLVRDSLRIGQPLPFIQLPLPETRMRSAVVSRVVPKPLEAPIGHMVSPRPTAKGLHTATDL